MTFIKRIWEGNASLPFTYWVVAVIGNAIFSLADSILYASGYYNFITQEKLIVIWSLLFVSTAYFIFTLVSVWRSAANYKGAPAWAILAKIAMVLGALKTLSQLAQSFQ
jgi:hypothetical protein